MTERDTPGCVQPLTTARDRTFLTAGCAVLSDRIFPDVMRSSGSRPLSLSPFTVRTFILPQSHPVSLRFLIPPSSPRAVAGHVLRPSFVPAILGCELLCHFIAFLMAAAGM